MIISLGGAPGPNRGDDRCPTSAVQKAVPDDPKPKQRLAAGADANRRWSSPVKNAEAAAEGRGEAGAEEGAPQLHGTQADAGAGDQAGRRARSKPHGAPIPFGGLATGGGGAGAARTPDYADFCCPEYLTHDHRR